MGLMSAGDGERGWASRVLPAAIAAWAVAVAVSMVLLWRFNFTPGAAAAAPSDWPAHSALTRAADRPTLIMFVKPSCLCTRASLGELAVLLSSYGERTQSFVAFEDGGRPAAEVESGEYWRRARALPGVTVLHDADGREGELFGAKTSGQTLIYDASGRLSFRGGITAARGHSGGNQGRARAAAALAGSATLGSEHRVFGCPLPEGSAP